MKFYLTTLVFIMLISCTPVRVISTENSAEMDFSNYETFGFYESPSSMEANPNLGILKEAIARELFERGIVRDDDPDLMINIAVDVEEKVQTRETDIREAPPYIGTRTYHWESEEIVVNQYEEGTVKIDMVDTESNRMVWQGIAAGTITEDQDKMRARIDLAMKKLFAEFPVNPTP